MSRSAQFSRSVCWRLLLHAAFAATAVLCAANACAQESSSTHPSDTSAGKAQEDSAAKARSSRESPPETNQPAITEDELRQELLHKTFYLRGGYLENDLHFDENGKLDGNSPQESYTLSLVEIARVHLTKHRLELEAERYGLHFLGALPTEDQSTAFDKVRLTSKKKPLRITIDREDMVKPKKEKHKAQAAAGLTVALDERDGKTSSQRRANQLLRSSIDRIFAAGIDARMIANLPAYWQLYYKGVATHSDYRPSDPAVLRQSEVDRKARLLTVLEPPSNEFAQKNGVAGMAMYHVVVGADGKPREIAVGRPIGFGLDESAVATLRKAIFEPAIKNGRPVPVELDVLVQFRIYSDRTAAASSQTGRSETGQQPIILPGPYSVPHPR